MKEALQEEKNALSHVTQQKRVQDMEQAMQAALAALQALDAALAQYRAALPMLHSLEEYYASPLWLQDYDADHQGAFPPTLRRGVLSEDGLYDLLCEHSRLRKMMQTIETEV